MAQYELEGNLNAKHKMLVPSIEDVIAIYDPAPADFYLGADKNKEIVAIGTACYHSVLPGPYDSHRKMVAYAAWDLGPGNLWIIPTPPKLGYPYSILVTIASLFKTETLAGRRADWFFWYDDDVVVPPDIIRKLRKSADSQERPFVAAAGYDRNSPFEAAVWQGKTIGEKLYDCKRWTDPPESGIHRVMTTGLCAAIFHRSFFDRLPQPWFSALPPHVEDDGSMCGKVNPDSWLCQQCLDYGMPIYVNCDVKITHMGANMPINTETVKGIRETFIPK